MDDLKRAQAVIDVLRMRVYELEEQLLSDRIASSIQISLLKDTIIALETEDV